MTKYETVFDDYMIKQLKKASKNNQVREILRKMLDDIEDKGPKAGKLIDSKLLIFEMKSKRPPIRLYFKCFSNSKEVYVFEYEMKTSEKKQKSTISKIRHKAKNLKSKFFSSIFSTFLNVLFKFQEPSI